MFRLLDAGAQLLTTGTMDVAVHNRDELFQLGELPPEKLVPIALDAIEKFNGLPSVLPEKPDTDTVNDFLVLQRMLAT